MNPQDWMSGADFNAKGAQSGGNPTTAAVMGVVNMATSIFGQVGANRYATSLRFKPEDVVIIETARDNRAYITMAGAVLIFAIALIFIFKK